MEDPMGSFISIFGGDMEQANSRKTAIYARVSTRDQSTGLEAQVRALMTYCEQNKITSYELFSDENQSGAKASRPALDRMMKAVEADEIATIIVFAFSRYARSVSHMLKGLETMRQHKTNFISVSERLDLNTSMGHVMFVLISAMAQLERDLISERVRCGIQNAKAKGIRIGRVRKRNSALIESLLEAGLSFREISRIARCSHGSVTAQKKEWVAKMLASEQLKSEALKNQTGVAGIEVAAAEMRAMSISEELIAQINSDTERRSIATTPSQEATVFYEGAD
jgi:DNA invertase Pin-like site-specific DNA recombinase